MSPARPDEQAGMAGGAGQSAVAAQPPPRVPLAKIALEWTRIGVTGFGGPPAHIALLRQLVVEREAWMDARSFQDANAACGLLPGPASTQLAIFCAYRVGGAVGALVGALGFIVPAIVSILLLSLLFLEHSPPLWVRGAGAGASGAVAAVALHAARGLVGPSFDRVRDHRARRARWIAYLVASTAAAALIGPYLVLVLLACGVLELLAQRSPSPALGLHGAPLGALATTVVARGGIGALAWTALKVGALAFGGGFVIVPLMQADAVHVYHWMSNARFLDAVALGQVTPGPVVATVAAVGYAAHGIEGWLVASVVVFTPSLLFILVGAPRFERLRESENARAFLDGAGPAAIGAIVGAAITLAIALHTGWQFAVLVAAAFALLVLRRGVVQTLVGAAVVGVLAAIAGASLP
ncbi:MAG TPA: chromate efflux transporter [Solirubrobacteraceae bacterium]|nr:chromate efflux transporter [Solirubrobacteraceae bacterium]